MYLCKSQWFSMKKTVKNGLEWPFQDRSDVRPVRELPVDEQADAVRYVIILVLAHHGICGELRHGSLVLFCALPLCSENDM